MTTNIKKNDLDFLKKKITTIRSAIFKAEINSILQLPNNIVTTMRMDDNGNIWFLTSCNGYYAGKIEKHFFGSLEYYQKGSDCHIKINGKAFIVDNSIRPKENSLGDDCNIALIRFKILNAEYFETKPAQTISLKDWVKDYFTELFIPKSHRFFIFPETIG